MPFYTITFVNAQLCWFFTKFVIYSGVVVIILKVLNIFYVGFDIDNDIPSYVLVLKMTVLKS